jgi:GAF domain-containing protein/CheY-like chemotaxis protein
MTIEESRVAELEKKLAEQTTELNQRTQELAVINSVQQGLVNQMDMQAIYDLVGDHIRDTFDSQAVIIATFDHESGEEHFGYAIEKGERFQLKPRPFDKLRQSLIDTKQKILINENFEEAYRQFGMRVLPGSEFPKSALYVPLILAEKVTGYVSLQDVDKENAFSESDVRLLETLSNSMSTALENARLLKETEQRTAELAVINSVQDALAKEMDIQAIYDLVGNRIRELFDAQAVGIETFDQKTETNHIQYLIEKGERYYPAPRPLNILRKHLIATREKILINKNFEEVAATFGKKIPGTEQPKSAVYVPLVIGERVTGCISLQNIDKENAFSESDVRLLETLANSMGVALENARLFDETTRLLKETEQQKAELGVINSVQEGLAKELNMQAIYDLVGDRIQKLFKAQAVVIATFDHESATEHFKYLFEDGQRFYLAPRPYDKLRQHLIVTKQKIVINTNYEEAYAKFGLRTLPGTNPTKSAVFVPLITGDKINSYISLQNNEIENAFNESDIRLLETLANSMSVALENARLFDETTRLLKETEQRTAELGVINSVQEGLARELDMKAIYDLVGNKIRDVFDAQVVMIATFEHETGTEKFNYLIEKGERYYPEARRYDKLRYQLIISKQKILINSNAEEALTEFGVKVIQGTEMPKSLIYVPLIVGNKVTSYVSLQNLDKENAFSDSDVRLLETLANSMSVALENARLFDETNRLLKETEQGKAELSVINSVQAGLVREMDIQGIYNLVGDRVQKLFNAQVVIIATLDQEKKMEYFNYYFEKGETSHPDPRHFDKVRKHLIETGQNILINEDVLKAVAEFGLRVVPGTEMPKSLLFMPLKVGDKVNGYVSLQNIDQEHAFSYSDVRLLSTLSNSMSVALENARLFDETNRLLKETEQRTAELAVINSVQDGLAKELDMQGIYHLVGDRVQKLFNAQTVIIASFDLKNKSETFNYFFENGEKVQPDPRPINKLRQLLIDKKQRLYISTEEEARKEYGVTAIGDTKMPKSLLFVPLLSGNIIRGYVSLQNLDTDHAFSESDIRLLETLANSMSVALENARLFDETTRLLKETEQRTAELSVINSVQDGLAKELDMQGIYNLVGDRVQKLFNAQAVIIATFDLDNKTEHFHYLFENGEKVYAEPRTINKLRRLLIDKKHSIYIPTEDQARKEFEITAITGTQMPKSLLFVPLLTGNIIKGYVSLQNIDFEHAFSKSDIRLLETLANSMSVALENARLFDETSRLLKETEQRTAELAVINSVQEGLARELDIQGIYNLIGDRLCELFPDTEALVIRTFDYDTGLEQFRYAIEKNERLKIDPRPFIWASQHLIRDRKPILINENYLETSKKYGGTGVTKGEPPKSAVFVPMVVGDVVKGSISLQNVDRENAFTESDLRLLTTLTNSMSVALENARLFDETNRLLKETEQRTAELAVINSVQDGLARELDIQAIYELVGERLRNLFPDTQTLVIRTFDHEKGLELVQYSVEKGHRFPFTSRPMVWANKVVIESKGVLYVDKDYAKKAKQYGQSTVARGEIPKCAVFVPMMVGDVVKGTISLQHMDRENAFSESDIRLLTTLTNSMSVALENARLFDETNRLLKETEQRTAELGIINSVQEGLASKLDIQAVYDLVGDKIRDVFDTQGISISYYDRKKNFITHPYYLFKGKRIDELGFELGKGLTSHIIETGQPLLINENAAERFKELGAVFAASETEETTKSWLGVPLISGGQVNGTIRLENYERENAYSESDVSLLQTLANSMSVALENARLFDETNRLLKETEQRTAELAVINSVQEGLAKELDMQGIYDLVGDRLCDLFPDTQTLVIRTFEHETGLEHWQYAIEKGERSTIAPRPYNWNSKLLIETKKPLEIRNDYVETAKKHGGTGVVGGKPPKSAVFVPMLVGDIVKGSVSLQNVDKENAFTDADLRLLTTITNSMSVALENARLFDETNRLLIETEQRTGELAVINSVQEGLVREIDMQAIYETVGERLCTLFNIQTVVIRTFDHENGLEHWQYAKEKGERQYVDPRPFNWNSRLLISTKKPLDIKKDYLEVSKQHGGTGVTAGQPPKSAVFVPMIVGDVVKGSVSLQNIDKENAFSDSDIRLLTTLTNSMSVALENARLFDETTRLLAEAKQRASELSTVNSISKALASQLDPDDLIKLVGDKLKDLFNANIVYLALLNQKTNTIHFPYQFGDNLTPMKLGEGLTSKIILTGEPLLINKDVKELTTQLGVKRLGVPAASYLGVPIPVGDEIIGVLSVQSTEHENSFNENDQRLLSTIAASVGVALRNATLFEDVKLAKMEAEAASKAAEKANEAKSAFLSTVSHELRTPLTSVLGFAKIIRKRLDEKIFPIVSKTDPKTEKTIGQISENLHVVISEGERLTHLINDVLDLAKIEAGKMEWNQENVSMSEVAERAIAATTSLFDQKALKLTRQIDTDLPEITGDRDKLIQVIINLISNAVKFTDKGTVGCRVYQEKDEIIVSISDTGIGIAPEDFSAVFEQFKQVGGDTLTDKPKGTGLGLPICKEIIEHHGGRIWLESEVGKGSTFSFALPVSKSGSAARPLHLNDLVKQLKEQVAQSQLSILGNASNILIVDDDESIRSLLNQELSDAGYIITEAGNGKEALESVRNHKPDLIILDIMMPEMNGFDVAAVLKNDPQTMDIPIIVLSVVQDKTRGFRIGVDRYLTKPIDTGLLFREVGNLLEQGKSKKKVMVVDQDSETVGTLTEVLRTKGYSVMEANEKELVEKAVANQPDIIIINSVLSGKQDIVQTLRFEKGLENVLFLVYQ